MMPRPTFEHRKCGAARPGATTALTAVLGGLAAFLVLCGSLLLGGLEQTGYPPYSSLRTDPSGTSIFFNAAQRNGANLIRGTDPDYLDTLVPDRTTLFFVVPAAEFDADASAELLRFVQRGGRLVVFRPRPWSKLDEMLRKLQSKDDNGDGKSGKKDKDHKDDKNDKDHKDNDEQTLTRGTLNLQLWDALHLKRHAGHSVEGALALVAPTLLQSESDSARAPFGPIPITNDGYLILDDKQWQPVYLYAGKPVVATRRLGKGWVVAATDPAMISNQQLSTAASADFSLWLTGGRDYVVADEIMHSLGSDRGTAWLLKRYHLVPALLMLGVLFALAIWMLVPGLLPVRSHHLSDNDQTLATESMRQGYIRLLQRAIHRRKLVAECREEWIRYAAAGGARTLKAGSDFQTPAATNQAGNDKSGSKISDDVIVREFNALARQVNAANPDTALRTSLYTRQ